MSLEIDIFNKLLKMRKENDHVKENTWSCKGCIYEPPSSSDGKPCCICEPSNPDLNYYNPDGYYMKEDEDDGESTE